jgi:hypothetical protein
MIKLPVYCDKVGDEFQAKFNEDEPIWYCVREVGGKMIAQCRKYEVAEVIVERLNAGK